MPTYEYECTRCDIVFEEVRPITAAPRQRCPHCRGKVERLISGGTSVVFRGSGFYVTDSRKSPPSAADKKDGNAAAGQSDAAAETGTGSAPDKGATSAS